MPDNGNKPWHPLTAARCSNYLFIVCFAKQKQVFLDCWSGVFVWPILQRTLKKELSFSPHCIRYLSVDNEDGVPFDLVMLMGLHSIW